MPERSLLRWVAMKKLIFGCLYVNSMEKVELVEMWLHLNRHLNPDCDFLLVETPAEEDLSRYIPSFIQTQRQIVSDHHMPSPLQSGLNWVCFTDNLGHLSLNGKDGWSRAFTYGLRCALENDYDYVAHIEADVLCRLKFNDIIAQMDRHNLGGISTIATKWNFMEIGLVYLKCDYLREVKFLENYNWETGTADEFRQRPEDKVAEALRGRFLYDLWPGGRDENDEEHGLFVTDEIPQLYFITHARRHWYYHRFMQIHAPALNWRHMIQVLGDQGE